MAKETDPVAFWGLGATFPIPGLDGRWQLRLDGRQGIMPARGGGVTSTFQLQLGVGIAFGLPRRAATSHVEVTSAAEKDSDGDGIPDRLDKCPTAAETVNGVADDDGCPEPDPDGDGIVGDADRCPNAPEDFDHFQDEDGCPDPDNDGDGIPDVQDKCPNDRETVNSYEDDDGCPDEVPAAITSAFAAASKASFDRGRARITPASERALEGALGVLRDRPNLRAVVIAHPAQATDADLAKKRAEAVKWYLVDQGVAQDQITTAINEPVRAGPVIEIRLGAAPASQPEK
jgi:OOP family OmpA-OmpF porin